MYFKTLSWVRKEWPGREIRVGGNMLHLVFWHAGSGVDRMQGRIPDLLPPVSPATLPGSLEWAPSVPSSPSVHSRRRLSLLSFLTHPCSFFKMGFLVWPHGVSVGRIITHWFFSHPVLLSIASSSHSLHVLSDQTSPTASLCFLVLNYVLFLLFWVRTYHFLCVLLILGFHIIFPFIFHIISSLMSRTQL